MGGAVSITPEYRKENTLSVFELFSSKKTTKAMFDEVASYGQREEGMRGKSDKIDLAELLLFITKEVNPTFTDAFVKNTMVIKQAFKFSMAADDNVSDGRIFKNEFIRAKQQILDGKIEGVTMSEISDEDWAKEFDVINSGGGSGGKGKGKGKLKKQSSQGDDFISFREFVAYTLKNIIKPAVYVAGQSSKDGADDEEGDGGGGSGGGEEGGSGNEGGDSGPNAFVRMMSGLIDDMEENDLEEERQEQALAELEKTEDEVEKGNEENTTPPPNTEVAPVTDNKEEVKTGAAGFIDEAIKSNQVTVFSKSFCPFCVKTKETLSGLENVTFKAIELDEMDNGADIQQALLELTGQKTVPNVFIGTTHLGGNDDTQSAFQSGKLLEMLGLKQE